MIEYLDVYTEDYKWSGKEPRDVVHRNGKWHYVFHCWVYDQKRHKIILQRRAETKTLFPKHYDASCTGHYSSDETYESTRELVEELGLEVSYDQLIYLMDFQDVFAMDGYYDREIARVHLLITDPFEALPSTPEEIDSIVACDYEAFRALILGSKDNIEFELLYGCNPDLQLGKEQLVIRAESYYVKAFELIHEHIKKL